MEPIFLLTNNFTRCADLAAQMLVIVANGQEIIPHNDWPEQFQGNAPGQRNIRRRACEALGLEYSNDINTLPMRICREILLECIARTQLFNLTVDHMRTSNRLVNVPNYITLQNQVNGIQVQLDNLTGQIQEQNANVQLQMNNLRGEINNLRGEIQEQNANVQLQINNLRGEIQEQNANVQGQLAAIMNILQNNNN